VALAIGLVLAVKTGVVGVAAAPTVVRTAAVGIAFFALCGYPVARALVGEGMKAHRALFVLPLGATVSSLALAVLGLLHVPLAASLAAVIAVAAIATARAIRRRGERTGTSLPAPQRLTPPPRAYVLRTAIANPAVSLRTRHSGAAGRTPEFASGYAPKPGARRVICGNCAGFPGGEEST